jgi:hypothetical protein
MVERLEDRAFVRREPALRLRVAGLDYRPGYSLGYIRSTTEPGSPRAGSAWHGCLLLTDSRLRTLGGCGIRQALDRTMAP